MAGRPYLPVNELVLRATAYDADYVCTGKYPGDPAYGVTASGAPARTDWTVAVDPGLIPLGALLYIEGMGIRRAEDTGSSIVGARIDVFVGTHDEALRFGVKKVRAWILADTHPGEHSN